MDQMPWHLNVPESKISMFVECKAALGAINTVKVSEQSIHREIQTQTLRNCGFKRAVRFCQVVMTQL